MTDLDSRYTPERVAELVTHWQATQSPRTFRKLMTVFQPAFLRWTRKYRRNFDEHEDLMQVGQVGLYKALRDYDATRGTRFATVANTYIAREMFGYIREHNGLIRIPVYVWEKDRDAAPPVSHLDGHPDDNEPSFQFPYHEQLDERLDENLTRTRVQNAIAQLTPREQAAIQGAYLDSELTLAQVARQLGVSYETMRASRAKAEKRLKELLTA